MAISMPTFILIFLHKWIPDSPRWLLKKGHIQEAKDIIIESAKYNDRKHMLPNEDELELQLRQQSEALYEYNNFNMSFILKILLFFVELKNLHQLAGGQFGRDQEQNLI